MIANKSTFLYKVEEIGEKMIEKITALPEKVAFGIGLSLLLGVPLLLFLLSMFFSFSILTTWIVEGLAFFLATVFILSAASKKHSRIDK